MDCLKKCVRITKQCMEVSVQVQLFVELLNYYIYFYERGNSNVSIIALKRILPFTDYYHYETTFFKTDKFEVFEC